MKQILNAESAKAFAFFAMAFTVFLSPRVLEAKITLNPVVSTGVEYTDNLFLSSKDEEDEFITTVSLGLTFSILEKLRGVEIEYEPTYSIYGRYDEKNTLRHKAGIFAWNDFDKFTRLEFVNRFLLTEDPLAVNHLKRDGQVIIPGDTTERRSREKYYTNTSILTLKKLFSKKNEATASILYSFLENDDPTASDNRRFEPSATLTYWFGQKSGMDAKAAYTIGKFDDELYDAAQSEVSNDFENWYGSIRYFMRINASFSVFCKYDHLFRDYDDDTSMQNGNIDYQVYHPMVGASYVYKEFLNMNIALGYAYQDEDGGDDTEGITADTQVVANWPFKRGRFSVEVDSGIDQNDFGAEQVGLEYYANLRCTASYEFFKDLSGEVSGGVRYLDGFGDDSGNGYGKRTTYTFGPGLTYLPSHRWVEMKASYRFTRFDGDSGGNDSPGQSSADDYSENRFWLEIILKPEIPWRL